MHAAAARGGWRWCRSRLKELEVKSGGGGNSDATTTYNMMRPGAINMKMGFLMQIIVRMTTAVTHRHTGECEQSPYDMRTKLATYKSDIHHITPQPIAIPSRRAVDTNALHEISTQAEKARMISVRIALMPSSTTRETAIDPIFHVHAIFQKSTGMIVKANDLYK